MKPTPLQRKYKLLRYWWRREGYPLALTIGVVSAFAMGWATWGMR